MTVITNPDGTLETAFPGLRRRTTMAMDFAMLGADGTPREQVSIRADAHHRLMQLAQSTGSPQLERVAEYYEDAEFAPAELPALLREIEALLGRCVDDQEMANFLRSLKELVSAASAAKALITVIAD